MKSVFRPICTHENLKSYDLVAHDPTVSVVFKKKILCSIILYGVACSKPVQKAPLRVVWESGSNNGKKRIEAISYINVFIY